MAIQKSFNTFPTLFLLMVFLITGCEEYLSDDSFLSTEADSYSGFMTNGWAAFSGGEYDDALTAFQSAAERDATQPEVYLGLGWSQLRLMNAVNAGSNFQKVISFAFLDETNSVQLLNHAHAGLTGEAVERMVGTAARGVVMAGVGEGNFPEAVRAALRRMRDCGVFVVRASRAEEGLVDREPDDDSNGFVAARALNPQKARLLLQVLIANEVTDLAAIQRAFDGN